MSSKSGVTMTLILSNGPQYNYLQCLFGRALCWSIATASSVSIQWAFFWKLWPRTFPLWADVFGHRRAPPGVAGGELPLSLVVQLHHVAVVLDVHQTAEGVHYSIEDGEDAQRRSNEIYLKDCCHHGFCGEGQLAAKEEEWAVLKIDCKMLDIFTIYTLNGLL